MAVVCAIGHRAGGGLVCVDHTQAAMVAAQAELQLIQAKNQAKMAEIQLEYQFKLQLAGMQVEGDILKEETRGDEKIKQIKFEKALDFEPEKKEEEEDDDKLETFD